MKKPHWKCWAWKVPSEFEFGEPIGYLISSRICRPDRWILAGMAHEGKPEAFARLFALAHLAQFFTTTTSSSIPSVLRAVASHYCRLLRLRHRSMAGLDLGPSTVACRHLEDDWKPL
jgi:hypothetical protein